MWGRGGVLTFVAMGVGEHFLCAGLTENRTRLSRHAPVRWHHPFLRQGVGGGAMGSPAATLLGWAQQAAALAVPQG